MGSVHRPQTPNTFILSNWTAAYLLLSSRHRRCCRGLCQACCAREAPEILDIESLCPRLLCAGSYAIWLALCHLALCHLALCHLAFSHYCANARTGKQNVACRSDARSCMWGRSLSHVPSFACCDNMQNCSR